MEYLYDVWPFNISSGPGFLLFFFVVYLAAWWAARLVGERLVSARERGEAEGIADDAVPSRAPPYRAPGGEPKRRLAIGQVPRAEDAWPIAYLRAGPDGLAETITASAIALGWVNPKPQPEPIEAPADPILRELHRKLDGKQGAYRDVRDAAGRIAASRAPEMKELLGRAGLLRNEGAVSVRAMPVLLVMLGMTFVSTVRFARAEALHRPSLLLTIANLGLMAFALFSVFKRGQGMSARANRYLRWLDSTTISLRHEVVQGRCVTPDEVVSAVAIAGVAEFKAAPLFVAAVPAAILAGLHSGGTLRAYVGTSSSGSGYSSSGSSCSSSSSSCSSSSSSCSSSGSSCGSGGSCGGGGCGGGGCGGLSRGRGGRPRPRAPR